MGDTGNRVYGLLWLVMALAFAAAGWATVTGIPWEARYAAALAVLSLVLCALSLPQARIGIYVNLALLAWIAIGVRIGARTAGRVE